jgi:hypothetical protein
MKNFKMSEEKPPNSILTYKCPVCGEVITASHIGLAVHNHYVKEIGKIFLKRDSLVIQEGKFLAIPKNWGYEKYQGIEVEYRARDWKNVIKNWREPDLVILKRRIIGGYNVEKAIEVLGTAEDYRILAAKVEKINRYVKPHETIVFDAIEFVDQYLKPERRRKLEKMVGHPVASYKEVDEYYQHLLREKYGLIFTLWFENELKKIMPSNFLYCEKLNRSRAIKANTNIGFFSNK